MVVKVMRCQHGREHGHTFVELYAHQNVDHRVGHEIVSIDTAIGDEPSRQDDVVPTTARQTLGHKRDFKTTRHS